MSKDEHKERQRVTKACDNCRKKKIKCDAKADMCSSCELLQIPCLYLDPTKKRGPPKGAGRHINAIEDRLHRMESIVGGFVEGEPTGGSGDENGSNLPSSVSSTGSKPRRRKSTKGKQSSTQEDDSMQANNEQQPLQHKQQVQMEHQHHPPPLQEYSLEHQQQQLQPHFQAENPFQPHQIVQSQHPSHFDLQLDSSQSPEAMSQTHTDDMLDPNLAVPLHQDLLRDSVFPAFGTPSPVLSSNHSNSEYHERSPGLDTLPQLGVHTPPSHSHDLDDLEEDMGHLTLDHKGLERYVGKSSPMFYNRRHWGGYSIREREQPAAQKFLDNPELPSPELMTNLLNLYFTYVHPFAPVFVWSKFVKRLQTKQYSPSFLFLLNSIFALAARFSDDLSLRTDPTKPETVGVRFVEKAKEILDTIYDAPDMYCVGALVLLSYQQMGTGGGYRAWMYIGLSIRMAQHLGLNRDCMKLNPHMPVLDREERNRIWWTCFVADRLVSASFGRPQGINEHDVDATYPEGIDEENIQLEYRLDGATVTLSGPSPHSEKNFVYMASLTRIMGRVMVSLYSPLSRATAMSSSLMNPAPLEQLDKELTDWLLTLPPHLQFRSVQQEPGNFVCTLHMTFYTTLILLHRPYSHKSAYNNPNDSSISLSICTSAANNCIEMASNLMRAADGSRDVPRLKCLLHSAVFNFFTAGLVHITNCTSTDPVLAASAKLRTVETLRCLSVMEDVWISSKWCGNNIKNLLKARNIELPCSVEGFKVTVRNGADTASAMNDVNPAQLELLQSNMVPKEQSFAFDVDQIMGYYQAPGIRRAEPTGRNSRHFSPTPYFSPVSPHHAQNQVRSHPGLTQGHAPLPRRPRHTKNTSPTPGNIMSSGSIAGTLSNNPATSMYTPGPSVDAVVPSDSNFFNSPLIDPFASPGSASVVDGLPTISPETGNTTGGITLYHNPFAATLWNSPTSMDNDEWIMYMQNGGSNGQLRSNDGSSTSPSGANGGGKAGIKLENGLPTVAENNPLVMNHSNASNSSLIHASRLHPLAQSMTRNDLMDSESEASGSDAVTLIDQHRSSPSGSLTPNGTLMSNGYASQGSVPTPVSQQHHHHQQQQQRSLQHAAAHHQHQQQHQHQLQQPLLPSQSPAEYEYFLSNGNLGAGANCHHHHPQQQQQQQQQPQASLVSQSWSS
ncbi:hypothetical protein BGZ47_005412 [Haplosporangium gracile]|nr:hypothetical protein BGZ47_005412 [Haplosporangium gracile]